MKAKIAYFIPYVFANLISKRHYINGLKRINCKYDYKNCKYIGATDSLYNSVKNRHLAECYNGTVLIDFEGYKFKAPVKYDEILRKMYGDYMTLPPEEKQVAHHSNKVYLIG